MKCTIMIKDWCVSHTLQDLSARLGMFQNGEFLDGGFGIFVQLWSFHFLVELGLYKDLKNKELW
jgi:hypothetical protein